MSLEISPSFLLNFSEGEMNGEAKHFYQFKSFRLDVGERQLTHGSDNVSLTPKAFDVLAALVTRGGHLVEKDELLKLVWSDSFVEEANIARIVHTLRRSLGENDHGNKFIETVAKKGYRFVAEVSEVSEMSAPHAGTGGLTELFEESADVSKDKLQLPAATDGSERSEVDKISIPQVSKQKYTTRFTLIAVGFLGAVFLFLLLSFNYQSEFSVKSNGIKSIAVLPLKSLTAENRNSLYELGIADSLINKLSPGKDLIVRPLSATRQYADIEQDAIAAGREQKVDYVLASNYQIAEGKIRITSQLINVQSGLVEEVFKDEENNASGFAVQDAVMANIGSEVLEKLSRMPNNLVANRGTTNEEAYRLYLQGTVLADKRIRTDVERAIEKFEQAVKLDPNYAHAYAGLGNAQIAVASIGSGSEQQYVKAKIAIEKALAIDDNLADAHSYSGELKMNYEWDFAGAEREYKRAIELNPNSSVAHRMYALLLGFYGRFDEAIAEIKTAIDLEPASMLNQKIYGQTLYYARRYDEAITQLQRAVETDPNFLPNYYFLIRSYRLKGDDQQTFDWFLRSRTKEGDNVEQNQAWKTIYKQSGWRGILEEQLKKLKENEKNRNPNYIQMVRLYVELNNREQAFAYLERVFDKHGWIMISLKVEPQFDSLRSDPRFDDLVKRVGLK